MNAETRRPDGGLYATQKRLQEEMCRQFHDAHALPVAVMRPDYIIDSRLGIGRHREDLRGGSGYSSDGAAMPTTNPSWVCRHDIAKACRLAIEKEIAFEILHVVDSSQGQATTCNVGRTEQLLGMKFKAAIVSSPPTSKM